MGKQILIILGGGRPKSNTVQLVAAFTHGAEAANHRAETVSPTCVQRDFFNGLVPQIKAADCIVFASLLYFWTLSAQIKAFIERFYCIAEEDPEPPLSHYEKYPVKDCALLMIAVDNIFWTFQQAESYYKFALVDYIGFHDLGMLLAGSCGDTNGPPQIGKTNYQKRSFSFGQALYLPETLA